MSIKFTRIRAIVMATLVLAFVIPWTYVHIAYAWSWKEQFTDNTCTGRHYFASYNEHRPVNLGTPSDGRIVFAGMTGKVSMGRKIGSFNLSARNNNNHYESIEDVTKPHRDDSIIVEGASTSTLKETHSDIVWFTPNLGKALFYFDSNPLFTIREGP